LKALLKLLHEEDYIGNSDEIGLGNPERISEEGIVIRAKGYRRLQELNKTGNGGCLALLICFCCDGGKGQWGGRRLKTVNGDL